MRYPLEKEVTKDHMRIAQMANPYAKVVASKKDQAKGQAMLAEIISKFSRVVHHTAAKAYSGLALWTDQSLSVEDIVSILNQALIQGIYTYRVAASKYEPYNYLMGIINMNIITLHNWRNRAKRIPFHFMISLDTLMAPHYEDNKGCGEPILMDGCWPKIKTQKKNAAEKKTEKNARCIYQGSAEQWNKDLELNTINNYSQRKSKLSTMNENVITTGELAKCLDIHSLKPVVVAYKHHGKAYCRKFSLDEILEMILSGWTLKAIVKHINAPIDVVRDLVQKTVASVTEEK